MVPCEDLFGCALPVVPVFLAQRGHRAALRVQVPQSRLGTAIGAVTDVLVRLLREGDGEVVQDGGHGRS
jgi:hypothetical protein